MDLVTTLRLMARRWIVVVPILLVSLAAAVVASSMVAPSYQARASVLVLPLAAEGTGPSGVNPYGEYGGQRLAVSHLMSLAGSAAFTREVDAGTGAQATFELTPQADVGLIDAVVTGPSNEETIAAMNRLIDLIDRSLGDLQRDIDAPRESWVQMRRLDTPEQAVQLAGSRNRVVVAVVALGLLASVGAAFALEGLIGRRTRAAEGTGRTGRGGRRRRSRRDRTDHADDPVHADEAGQTDDAGHTDDPDHAATDVIDTNGARTADGTVAGDDEAVLPLEPGPDVAEASGPDGPWRVPESADPDPASAR